MIDGFRDGRLRDRRHATSHAAAIIVSAALLHACTRPANSEAPILQPEPVVELSDAAAKQPSLAVDTLDRAHWPIREVDPIDGGVEHVAIVTGRWARGAEDYPTTESALSSSDDSPANPVFWAIGPIEALWQIVRAPVVLIWDDLPGGERASPVSDYERAPAAADREPGLSAETSAPSH